MTDFEADSTLMGRVAPSPNHGVHKGAARPDIGPDTPACRVGREDQPAGNPEQTGTVIVALWQRASPLGVVLLDGRARRG
jgi:hypothetical protein